MVTRRGQGICLAATWDLLGIFPSRASGLRGAGRRTGGLGASLRPVCSRSIRRRGGRPEPPQAPKEQRSAAALDQSPRRSSPWQLQHQVRPPRGSSAAKSHTGPELGRRRVDGRVQRPRRPLPGPRWKPGNLLRKCARCPGACNDSAFQGGFCTFGTETFEPPSVRVHVLESGRPLPNLALPSKGLGTLGRLLSFWEA